MSPAVTYVLAAALTLVIEVPTYVVSCRVFGWASWSRALVGAVAVNVVTHPALYAVTQGRGTAYLLVAEVMAVVVEAALLTWWWRARRDALLVGLTAFIANGLSFGLGGLVLGVVTG